MTFSSIKRKPKMGFDDIKTEIQKAIKRLQLNDEKILRDGLEWAFSHRLAVYLEYAFSGWDVDCEYTREGSQGDSKTNSQGKRKRPDVIIHRRWQSNKDDNLLVIELKFKNDDGNDDAKLREFTSKPKGEREFQYQYGLALSFKPALMLKWYENGQEIPDC
ncbi:MAG: hypothetical protein U9N41_00915 [Euryarchaeota archaeon]|nr:hypothetical protein [Euryarchaeota archaeon]